MLSLFFSLLRLVSSLVHQCLAYGDGLEIGTSLEIASLMMFVSELTAISTPAGWWMQAAGQWVTRWASSLIYGTEVGILHIVCWEGGGA